jgi:hypothetical protein
MKGSVEEVRSRDELLKDLVGSKSKFSILKNLICKLEEFIATKRALHFARIIRKIFY